MKSILKILLKIWRCILCVLSIALLLIIIGLEYVIILLFWMGGIIDNFKDCRKELADIMISCHQEWLKSDF